MNLAHFAASLLTMSAIGCCSLQEAGRDASELGHIGMGFGFGLRAHVQLGDLVHIGAGGEMALRGGYAYGTEEMWLMGVKGNLLLLHGETVIGCEQNPATCWQTPPCHGCPALAPVLTNRRIRTWVHRFDIDIEVMVGFIAFGIGFSPGELVEFIATLFGADFDPEQQENGLGVPNPIYEEPRKPEKTAPE
ncbi:MAG: hypothetical protein IT452_00395 [Planctomycetia bacterium]|nr:hypothetical protein [Planctomycetia bacterium]